MLLYLFIVFMIISLILIALSFYRPEHSELGIVGFLFLFLLSMVIMYGDIQYKVGETLNYSCLCCENARLGNATNECSNGTNLYVTSKVDLYETWNGGGTLSHIVGYYLAIASIVGFIGVILGLRRIW